METNENEREILVVKKLTAKVEHVKSVKIFYDESRIYCTLRVELTVGI